jgi:hypothetical protein
MHTRCLVYFPLHSVSVSDTDRGHIVLCVPFSVGEDLPAFLVHAVMWAKGVWDIALQHLGQLPRF